MVRSGLAGTGPLGRFGNVRRGSAPVMDLVRQALEKWPDHGDAEGLQREVAPTAGQRTPPTFSKLALIRRAIRAIELIAGGHGGVGHRYCAARQTRQRRT